MKRFSKLAALALFAVPFGAGAWDRGHANTFATLPPGTAHPEGITVDRHGRLYVATFDVSRAAGPGRIVVFDHDGQLVRVVDVAGSSNLLLGIDFHRVGRHE